MVTVTGLNSGGAHSDGTNGECTGEEVNGRFSFSTLFFFFFS